MLTSKCASHHNSVRFFDISTSKSAPNLVCFVHVDFEICFAPQRRALFHISTSKSAPNLVCFVHLTSKFSSRHNGVHFFDISTSKSGPRMVCFVRFDFEMCFTPQQHALFRHLNFKKCSEREVLLAFSLVACKCASRHNVCNFSSLIWPAGSAPAA